jgi:hypothetical protein
MLGIWMPWKRINQLLVAEKKLLVTIVTALEVSKSISTD